MKIWLLLVMLTLNINSYGQRAVLATPHTRVFYTGLDNLFEVSYPGIVLQDIVVKSDTLTCRVNKTSDFQYSAKVMLGAKSCNIYIGVLQKGHVQWKDTLNIDIRNFPKGEIRFGMLQNVSNVSLLQIMQQQRLLYHNDAYFSQSEQVRVTKYHLIVIPRRGTMQELTVLGDSINYQARALLGGLKDGDMIVIEGIRANFFGSVDKPLNPIVLTISDHANESPTNTGKVRITGYFRSKGRLEQYIFPLDKYSFNREYGFNKYIPTFCNDISPKQKDSVWSYFLYNHWQLDYLIYRRDSFYQSKLVCSFYYNDTNSRLDYRVQKVTDSSWNYESYYPNGRVYQRGLVMEDNSLDMAGKRKVYKKSSFYENEQYPVRREKWEKPLFDIHEGWRPVSQWEVYDSSGRISMKLQYNIVPDILNPTGIEESVIPMNNYIVVVDGPVIFYKPNGKVKKVIMLKGGKLVR